MRWCGFLWTLAISILGSTAEAHAWTTQPYWHVTFDEHAYDGLEQLEAALDRLQYEHGRLARTRRWSAPGGGMAVLASSGAAMQADDAVMARGDDMAELTELLALLDERRSALSELLATEADPAYRLLFLVRLEEAVRVAKAVERDIAALRTGARQQLMITSSALVTGARASVTQAVADSGARIVHTEIRGDHVLARVMTAAGDELVYWGGLIPLAAGAVVAILGLGLLWGKRHRPMHLLVIRIKKDTAMIMMILGISAGIAGAWITLARHGEYRVVLGTTRCNAAELAAAETMAHAHSLAGALALCEILAVDDASAERAERMLHALRQRR